MRLNKLINLIAYYRLVYGKVEYRISADYRFLWMNSVMHGM